MHTVSIPEWNFNIHYEPLLVGAVPDGDAVTGLRRMRKLVKPDLPDAASGATCCGAIRCCGRSHDWRVNRCKRPSFVSRRPGAAALR
jgi:hypothetical protein